MQLKVPPQECDDKSYTYTPDLGEILKSIINLIFLHAVRQMYEDQLPETMHVGYQYSFNTIKPSLFSALGRLSSSSNSA